MRPCWFISEDSGRTGPFSSGELANKQTRGEVGPATLVWREGFEGWRSLSEIEELREPSESRSGDSRNRRQSRPPIDPVPGTKTVPNSHGIIAKLFRKSATPYLVLLLLGASATGIFVIVDGVKNGDSSSIVLALGAALVIGLSAVVAWEALRSAPRWLIEVETTVNDRVILDLALLANLLLVMFQCYQMFSSYRAINSLASSGLWGQPQSGNSWTMLYIFMGTGVLTGAAACGLAVLRPAEIGTTIAAESVSLDVGESFCGLLEAGAKLTICLGIPMNIFTGMGSFFVLAIALFDYTFAKDLSAIDAQNRGIAGGFFLLATGVGMAMIYLTAICLLACARFLRALLQLFPIEVHTRRA